MSGRVMNPIKQEKFACSSRKKKKVTGKQPQKSSKKSANLSQAEFEDMNQIEWFPVDPYCD